MFDCNQCALCAFVCGARRSVCSLCQTTSINIAGTPEPSPPEEEPHDVLASKNGLAIKSTTLLVVRASVCETFCPKNRLILVCLKQTCEADLGVWRRSGEGLLV